jgi:predicted transcriptional regulator
MKSTTIPPLRVSAAFRREVESLLAQGETLSGFMLDALQRSVGQRRDQQVFVARGLASAARARKTGRYVPADQVLAGLTGRLAKARRRAAG